METGHVQINLLGTSFTIKADEDPAYLNKLVDYLGLRTREIEGSVSIKDPLRIALLTAILIADDLFKERDRSRTSQDPDSKEAERLTGLLIEQIDRSLSES